MTRDNRPLGKPGLHVWLGQYGADAVAINRRYGFYAQNMKFVRPKDISGWRSKRTSWVGLNRRLRSDSEKGTRFRATT